MKSLQLSLASGALSAKFIDEGGANPIPAWAWLNTERVAYAWREGRLPIDALLPERWARWSRRTCFVDRDAFRRWLKVELLAISPASLHGTIPSKLPTPKRVTLPLPEVGTHVSLSIAISWLAFGRAFEMDDLLQMLQTGEIGEGAAWAEVRLAAAAERLLDAGVAGTITLAGKYRAARMDTAVQLTEAIPAIRLLDFRRFGPAEDALLYGRGLAYRMDGGVLRMARNEGRKDFFSHVLVDRSELLERFGGDQTVRDEATSPTKRPVSAAALKGWFDSLGSSSERLSQRELHARAKAHFAGHTVARQAVRELTQGRKRGPKPNGR